MAHPTSPITPSAPTAAVPPDTDAWRWAAGVIVAGLLVALGWFAGERRGRRGALALPAPVPTKPEPPAPEPEPEPSPAPLPFARPRQPVPSPPPAPRPAPPRFLERAEPAPARVELAFEPKQGGLNLLSATVEGDLVVRNAGTVPVEDVRVDATLLPARADQADELAALLAGSVARPEAPLFALAAGQERRVRIVAVLPIAGMEPLHAGGRPLLIPLLAARAEWRGGRTGDAWVIGVERAGQLKLGPFWLDAPRRYDALAARPHAP